MSFDTGGLGPQQPYTTDHLQHANKMQLGNPQAASLVAVAFGVVAVLLVTLTPVGWAAVTCGLVAILAGLSGQLSPNARIKYTSWTGFALGVVTLTISVST